MSNIPVSALFAFGLTSAIAYAQVTAPDALVKRVTADVINSVKQDPAIQSGSSAKAATLIEQKVLPYFDFVRMTSLAMGPHWRQATPEQQKRVVDQFRSLLVRTYSSALAKYRDQVIETKAPRTAASAEGSTVVRSTVTQSGAEPITIDYSMERSGSGDWKVYDIAVAGVSLVTTYRDTFAREIRDGGVDGLIKSLAAKNGSLAAKSG